MPDNPKILGQVISTGGSDWITIYTVPSFAAASVGGGAAIRGQLAQTVISSLVVCNTNTNTPTFSVGVQGPVSAAAGDPAGKELLFSAMALTASETKVISPGITLGAGDVVTVLGSNTEVAFNLFGTEVS